MSQTDWAKIYAAMDKRIVVRSSNCQGGSKSASGRKRGTNKQKIPKPNRYVFTRLQNAFIDTNREFLADVKKGPARHRSSAKRSGGKDCGTILT